MKISGFTLIRNGIQFDYPFLESYRSLLPLVDELIINVGISDDATKEQLEKFASQEGKGKIILFDSKWPLDNPEKKKSGLILSEQTNLALDRCQNNWCFYLQSDEVLHEDDYSLIKESLKKYENDQNVDGLLFNYLHFYGSYDVIQKTRSAYRREVRVIKKSSSARSVGDAQSFRKKNNEKLTVTHSNARVFHYGWVRPPEVMKEKTYFMDSLYHGDYSKEDVASQTPATGENYRYKRIWGLTSFNETHPKVMLDRIQKKGWHWNLKKSPFVWKLKDFKKVILDSFEKITGIRLFEYRSYRLKK